jgi:hypothetical protein
MHVFLFAGERGRELVVAGEGQVTGERTIGSSTSAE